MSRDNSNIEDNYMRNALTGAAVGVGAGALLGEFLDRDYQQNLRINDNSTKQAVGNLLELEFRQGIASTGAMEPGDLTKSAIEIGQRSIEGHHPRNWLLEEHLKAYREFEIRHGIVGSILDTRESAVLERSGHLADLTRLKPGTLDEITANLRSTIERENIPYFGKDRLREKVGTLASDYGIRELTKSENVLQNLSRRSLTGIVAFTGATLGFMGVTAYEILKPRNYYR